MFEHYSVGPFDINIAGGNPARYVVGGRDPNSFNLQVAELRSSFILDGSIAGQRLLKLPEILGVAIDRARGLFAGRISEDECAFVAFKLLRLDFLYVPLVDKRVTEIFITGPAVPIQIEHYGGRMLTNIVAEDQELRGLIARLAFDNNVALNISSPTLKASSRLLGWKCRFCRWWVGNAFLFG